MIRTSYFSALSTGSEVAEPAPDDLVLGVVRRPRDFVHAIVDWNEETLGPPEDLLAPTKQVEEAADEDGAARPMQVAWATVDFESRYRDHLAQPEPHQVLQQVQRRVLDRADAGHDVWLICWERDPLWCHRRLLADVLASETDIDVAHHPAPDEIERESSGTQQSEHATLDQFQGGSA